jgi:signal transduction histidine kinase
MGTQQNRSEQELLELQTYGQIAEAVGPVLHEVGNLLNTMVLETGSMERRAPEEFRPGCQRIRQAARQLSTLLHQFAAFRHNCTTPNYPVDLHEVLERVVRGLGTEQGRVTLNVAHGALHIAGTTTAVELLTRLLLDNALRVAGQGKVGVWTARQEDQVRLAVEDVGPALPTEAAADPLSGATREGEERFQLACCHGIVRHLQGTWATANRPGGGVTTTIWFPICG